LTPRPATPDDARDLAAIHVRAWEETYTGLLPPEEVAARDRTRRLAQWQGMLAQGRTRVALIPGFGFAQAGPQREAALAARWPEELLALYVLKSGHGTGAGLALLSAVLGAGPFSAVVLKCNGRACRFYEKTGGRLAEERPVTLGTRPIIDLLYVWDNGLKLP